MIITASTLAELAVPLPGGRALTLGGPVVMGVINVTPDSFSDGGRHLDADAAVRAGEQMIAAGAGILDVGGESTRPGAAPVTASEELSRVLPIVERLARLAVPVSIDTRKAEVAAGALAVGATIVNDVTGLGDPDMARITADAGAALILGHIQGQPRSMQDSPSYDDVVAQVVAFLSAARERAVTAGVAPASILVDPGIGFGKRLEDNLDLLACLDRFSCLGPVVIGVSRKSMLGDLLDGRPVHGRLAGGLGAAIWAALAGARVVRTHDVGETVDALRVLWSIRDRARGEDGHRVV